MNQRTVAAVLRSAAIVIAVAALIDPVFTVQRPIRPALVLLDLLHDGDHRIAQRLREIDPNVIVRTPVGHRIPCGTGERCVAAVDGSQDADVPADLDAPFSVIIVKPAPRPNIAIRSAAVSANQHASAAGAASVMIANDGDGNRRASVRVTDGEAVIGTMAVELKAGEITTVDVPWWPIAPGARVLRIAAIADGADGAAFDNAIDVPVTVENGRMRVLVFDPRPSWSSTFVRRALEDDPRFLVDHRARVAPAISAGTATGRLDVAALDRVAVVVVGAPDALTAPDVELLDRFVRIRGGGVVLLPERMPSGPARPLFTGEWVEQLRGEPEGVGALRATELLRPRAMAFGSVAISPVIVATPAGNGRIVISGAMDAWRYRDAEAEPGAFDRFWTSLAAEMAELGEQVRIEIDAPLAAPGSRVPFTVRYRAMSMPAMLEAAAVARCDGAHAIRLWPSGLGTFRGELPVGAESCAVDVAIDHVIQTASVAVAERPARGVAATITKLARAARVSGGAVTDEDNLQPIRDWNEIDRDAAAAASWFPMRSPWWLVPFVACVSIEWWLRRRNRLK